MLSRRHQKQIEIAPLAPDAQCWRQPEIGRFRPTRGEYYPIRRRSGQAGDISPRPLDQRTRRPAFMVDGRGVAGAIERFEHGRARLRPQRGGRIEIEIAARLRHQVTVCPPAKRLQNPCKTADRLC